MATNGKDDHNHKFQKDEIALAQAFMSGVQVISIALIGVLKRKTAVGLITDELGQAIFKEVGDELTTAIEALPDGVPPQEPTVEQPQENK